MKFTEWLNKTGLKRDEIAAKLGISRQSIHNITRGSRPNWELARRIVTESGGKVSIKEWYK